jgi:hypothetical protein
MKFSFDKFIKDIVKRELTGHENIAKSIEDDNTPSRKYNELYTDRWQSKTRYRGKNEK